MNLPQSSLDIDTSLVNGVAVVDLQGELDIYTAPRLRSALAELVSQGSYQIVIILKNLDVIDSAGLGVLIGGLKRCREHSGNLVLVSPRDKVMQSLEITRLNKILDISPSPEDGIKSFSRKPR